MAQVMVHCECGWRERLPDVPDGTVKADEIYEARPCPNCGKNVTYLTPPLPASIAR